MFCLRVVLLALANVAVSGARCPSSYFKAGKEIFGLRELDGNIFICGRFSPAIPFLPTNSEKPCSLQFTAACTNSITPFRLLTVTITCPDITKARYNSNLRIHAPLSEILAPMPSPTRSHVSPSPKAARSQEHKPCLQLCHQLMISSGNDAAFPRFFAAS